MILCKKMHAVIVTYFACTQCETRPPNFTGLLAVTNCLDSDDKDLLVVCCGVLINMTSDDNSREAFKNYDGVSKLVNILRLTGERDWTLSALICQTLWNVCSARNSFPGDPMTVLDTLVKLTGGHESL